MGSLFFLQGIFPNPGIKPGSPALQADPLSAELPGKPLYIDSKATWSLDAGLPVLSVI